MNPALTAEQSEKRDLFGRPSGFSWDDVDVLRCAAMYYPAGDVARKLDGIADRIAALLPPRDS